MVASGGFSFPSGNTLLIVGLAGFAVLLAILAIILLVYGLQPHGEDLLLDPPPHFGEAPRE